LPYLHWANRHDPKHSSNFPESFSDCCGDGGVVACGELASKFVGLRVFDVQQHVENLPFLMIIEGWQKITEIFG